MLTRIAVKAYENRGMGPPPLPSGPSHGGVRTKSDVINRVPRNVRSLGDMPYQSTIGCGSMRWKTFLYTVRY